MTSSRQADNGAGVPAGIDWGRFRFEMLKAEIDLVNGKIKHFDNLRLRTRQMAIVLWTATLGFGVKEDLALLVGVAALVPLPFWSIETNYIRYYRGMYARLRAIRDFLRDGRYEVQGETVATLEQFLGPTERPVFPVFDYWAIETIAQEEHRRRTKFARVFLSRMNLLIYVPMSLSAIGLSLYLAS